MDEKKLHPIVPEMRLRLEQGRITRREFLRIASLLGVSAAAAQVMASCAPAEVATQAPAAATAVPATVVPATAVPPTAIPPTAVPTAVPTTAASLIKRGGTMRIATRVPRVDDPARYSWTEGSNIIRNVCEYLTYISADSVTHPWLLESWSANDEVNEWTLKLRQGIKFNDGSDLTSEDIIFNLKRWIDPDVGSSMMGLLSAYLTPENIEKVDDYTVKMYFTEPNIGFPEHVYDYAAQIVSRNFEGDILKAPVGTGPFLLDSYSETERAVLKRRTDYWKMGADGSPLPYLDELIYFDLGDDQSAWLAALDAKQVDRVFNPLPDQIEAFRKMDHVNVLSGPTGATYVVRMRCDQPPFDNNDVRLALKMCQDRQKTLQLAHYNEGVLSADAHVSPANPAFVEKPIPGYDPEGAKELLAKAGYPDGLDITITAMSNTPEGVIATTLAETAAAGGFKMKVDLVPSNVYWEQWTELPLGVTVWGHRPLDTQNLRLAYTVDADGKPVAWNETKWVDKEFNDLLAEAEKILDTEKRKEVISKLMDIQIERGSVGISFWRNHWTVCDKHFKDVPFEPNNFDNFVGIWYDPEG
jgi:peptide/nickel transport system substrate-binding protein